MATVGAILQLIFPRGTVPPKNAAPGELPRPRGKPNLIELPSHPPDAFAAVAVLLDWSGAYQYIWPAPGSPFEDPLGVLSPEARRAHEVMAVAWAFFVPFEPDQRHRRQLAEQAATFLSLRNPDRSPTGTAAEIETAGALLQPLWDTIINCQRLPVLQPQEDRGPDKNVPEWWRAATRLLVIADEACAGIGFHHEPRADGVVPKDLNQTFVQVMSYEKLLRTDKPGGTVVTPTFCSKLVSSDVVAVLPKTRTSQVGCTMRALTHNLAPIFSRGQVSAQWHVSRWRPIPACERGKDHGTALNLLLVPFPYRIPSRCFLSNDHESDGRYRFSTGQPWLTNNDRSDKQRPKSTADDLTAFVKSLCSVCEEGNVPIHGIVFPEFSLDWFTFDNLSRDVAYDFGSVEFVIAGVSDSNNMAGNFVVMRGRVPWADKKRWDSGTPVFWDYECVRGKHHPWILNKAQMQRYGVSHRFSDRQDAWERIHVGQRIIDFVEPRSGTSMTTLICEDLARIDPCQQVIRAVGPNLVIALLMDGPQILTRWPRHYASVLADDPGSSVLTFSSLGLIERASPTDRSRSRAIALWKDVQTEAELHLTTGAHALAVSLEASRIEEMTLDGRGDGLRSYLWRLAQVQTVRAQQGAKDWILQGAGEF